MLQLSTKTPTINYSGEHRANEEEESPSLLRTKDPEILNNQLLFYRTNRREEASGSLTRHSLIHKLNINASPSVLHHSLALLSAPGTRSAAAASRTPQNRQEARTQGV